MKSDNARGPREIVYDEQINPLVAKVIAICKEHGVASTLSFSLDGDLQCTVVVTKDGDAFTVKNLDDEEKPN